MNTDQSQESLLKEVIDAIVENNQSMRPGTPLAELKEAIEGALQELPPLQIDEFNDAVADTDAPEKLVARAPELIGWDADSIVEWVEKLSSKLEGGPQPE